jgi:hypothetical protein
MQPGTKHALEFLGTTGLVAAVAYLLWPKPTKAAPGPEKMFFVPDYPPETSASGAVTIAVGGGIPGNPVQVYSCEPADDCSPSRPCGAVIGGGYFDDSGYFVVNWTDPPPPSEAYYVWVIDTATGNYIGDNGATGSGCFSGTDCCS